MVRPEDVRRLEALTVQTQLRSPRGRFDSTFTGPLLLDYARATGLIAEGPNSDVIAASYFVVRAADGFRVAVSLAEALPDLSGKQVILAYEQNGEPIRAGLRLVVPGDDLGGRSVYGVESIELKQAAKGPATAAPDLLMLSGLVERQGHLDARDIVHLRRIEIETPSFTHHDGPFEPSRRYTGALLIDVFEWAGLQLDEAINEDILSKVLVARGADGYVAVVAAGEIEPRFRAGEAVVAFEPNESSGMTEFRLVVPFERGIARNVKRLRELELRQA